MNKQLEILKEREKRYEAIYKKVLFHIQLLKENNVDEQQIKDTTLDCVDMAIKLNNVREEIYKIESERLISKQVKSAEEERMRISELVDLASKRKEEIAELFSNQDGIASPELEKQTNEFILYSDKLKIIDSYLEMKEKEKLLIKENESLIQKEIDLKAKMEIYEQENTNTIRNLDDSVDKIMSLFGFSFEDEERIVFEAANQLRNEELNKQILENIRNIDEQSIQEEHQKVIQNIKKNRKKDTLDYYHAYEKYYILQIKQIMVGMKIDDFSKIYDDLLTILSIINERLKLRNNNKIEETDTIDFFYEEVVNAIHKLEKQIADRTTLDSVIIKQEENNKNITFYHNLISNSTDIKRVLGEVSEEVEETQIISEEKEEETPQIIPEEKQEETPQIILEEKQEEIPQIIPEETIVPKTKEVKKVVALPELQEENDKKEETVIEEIPMVKENQNKEVIHLSQPEETVFTQKELYPPKMEAVTQKQEDPNTIVKVDDASNELKGEIQKSYLKFKNWFTKNWKKINKMSTTPGNTRKLK